MITVLGVDGNPYTTRDVDGTGANYVYTRMKLQFSGNYPTGGDTLDLSSVASLIPAGAVPILAKASPMGTSAVPSLSAAGGLYQVIQNAAPTLANYLLKIFANSAGSTTEYSAGAYGTDVLGDIVILECTWRKLGAA